MDILVVVAAMDSAHTCLLAGNTSLPTELQQIVMQNRILDYSISPFFAGKQSG